MTETLTRLSHYKLFIILSLSLSQKLIAVNIMTIPMGVATNSNECNYNAYGCGS